MPSYFLPYPKTKPQHAKKKPPPPPLQTSKLPYPHPQPDPPNNPPSPLNLSSSSPSSSSSSSSSSTIKPRPNRWKQDYSPSILKLQIVCGDPRDPSLVVVFGLKFREGRRPKVRFSVKRGHGKAKELRETLGLGDDDEGKGREEKIKESRGRKGKRESEN